MEMRNSYKILDVKSGGKKPLGRPSLRWGYSIKTNVTEAPCTGVDWIPGADLIVQWLFF
jgi:hypothetical protein